MSRSAIPTLILGLNVLLLSTGPLRATEPHAILARGFEAEQVYDFNGLDHVNLFSGNLVVTIPIGQRYPLRAGFDYGFTLVYNSHIWDYVVDCPIDGKDEFGDGGTVVLTDPRANPGGCLRGLPNPKSNAGTSWRLSLGELYDIDSPLFTERGWRFVGPDGAEHTFGPREGEVYDTYPHFSRQGSHLRLRPTSAAETPACQDIPEDCMAIDRPDGVTYAFEPIPGPVGWRLRRIQDPFGNWVSITYSAGQWTVEDSLGRLHWVDFDAEGMISAVTLAAFGGTTAPYTFVTEPSAPILPACPHDFDIEGESEHEILTHLTAVILPDGSRYSLSYVADDEFPGICSAFEGRLESITPPTQGTIEYAYVAYRFPDKPCDPPPIRDGGKPRSAAQFGIGTRSVRDLDGNLLSETHYRNAGPHLTAPTYQSFTGTCILPRTTFTDVYERADQNRYRMTRHFFSVAQEDGLLTDPNRLPGEKDRYGLPVDHLTPDESNPQRFRSSMVFDCPSFPAPTQSYGSDWQVDARHLMIPTSCYDTDGDGDTSDQFLLPEDVRGLRDLYLEHEAGELHYCDGNSTTTPECERGHWPVKSELTYFYDTPGRYHVETIRSDFDGFGHYRTTTTRSNRPESVEHETHVAYRPEVGPQTWLLELFDERTITEGSQTSRESYVFDRTTGFLEARTVHRTGGNLIADLEPDGFGNVATETYGGGDFGQQGYVLDNQFANGTLARSEYVQGGRTILRTVDADVDADTGLPAASRDPSGLETRYSFDVLGRLTALAQQGSLAEAPTSYHYTAADATRTTGDPRASVAVTRGDTISQIFFDGLGRVNEERTTLPGGVTNRRFTTFTPMGQADTVTTLHDAAAPASARTTRTDYDVFGRPTRVWHPDDGLTSSGVSQSILFYEGIFQTTRQLSHVETPEGPARLRTAYHYDHQGRLVEVRELELDADSPELRLSTRYLYDEGGRLVRVSQGGGTQVRTFDYDGAGLLTQECHPELAGGCLEYGAFDARGNPGRLRYSRADGEAFELDYVYDGAERLTQLRRAQGNKLLKELFYTNLYNGSGAPTPAQGNGKLYQAKRHNYLGALDIVATETSSYGGIGGRLSRRTLATGGDGDVPRVLFTTDFDYDSLGNLAAVTYPRCLQVGCGAETPGRIVSNSYTRGLLTAVGTPGDFDQYASLTYHPNLTVDQVIHGNGVRDDLAQDPSQMPRPGGIQVRTGATPGAGTLWEATYRFDGSGNLASRQSRELDGTGALLVDATDFFRYDNAFNRLVSATVHYPAGSSGAAESRGYTHDPLGNLTAITGANPRTLSSDPATNRLLAPFTYDGAGNLTSQPAWDASGHPTGAPAWYYDYDALNLMIRAQNAAGSVTREYLYTADDERLAVLAPGRELWTVRGADAKVLRDFEYLSTGWRWLEDYVHGGAGLLASEGDVGGERHYHLDHLGSPRLVTGPEKQVLARHVFAPYGEELTAPNQDELRMKFTGHERDALDLFNSAGDLDYMHARYCSPQVGRFLSIDSKSRYQPLEQPQHWNRYTYTAGSPLKYIDPDGKDLVIVGRSKALRKFLIRSLRRPTFRQAVTQIANDRNFTVMVKSAQLTTLGEVERQRRQGKNPEITFGTTARDEVVENGVTRTRGAHVSIDTAMVQREHPDPTGVVTTAHEIAGHAIDLRRGASDAEMLASHAAVEKLGYEVKNEPPDISEKEAEKLLKQLERPPQ